MAAALKMGEEKESELPNTATPSQRLTSGSQRQESSTPLSLAPTKELLQELVAKSDELESASPHEILRWTVERFAPYFTMATAFGPEGMTIIHMLAEIAPGTPIFNLETGYQFKETLELRERVKDRYGIEVEYKLPRFDRRAIRNVARRAAL